ncbi:ubiquitin-conjugating enzyme family protein [Pleurotus pulmonarius]
MSVQPMVMRRLMRELTELKKSPPEGIRVQTSEDNMLDVTGIIEGPEGTPYADGYFKVKFKFTEEFPAAPPKCWFATKIFHPNVSTAGEICVNTLKKDWKSEYGIGHILLTVKCLLIYPNPESALDEEAGKLLLEDYKSYCNRAKLITSVHARAKPVEFNDATSKETSANPVASSSTLPTSTITPLPTGPIFSLPLAVAPIARKSSPAPPTHNESQNARKSLGPDKDGSKDKERHVSPSPLSTADANVVGGAAAAVKSSSAAPGEAALPQHTKAVKRAATSSAATGAEKRKKALKRL